MIHLKVLSNKFLPDLPPAFPNLATARQTGHVLQAINFWDGGTLNGPKAAEEVTLVKVVTINSLAGHGRAGKLPWKTQCLNGMALFSSLLLLGTLRWTTGKLSKLFV